MISSGTFLENRVLGNTIENYLWFAGILLAGILFKKLISVLFSRVLFSFLSKRSKDVGVNKLVGLLTKPFSLFVLVITFYLAFDRLEFPPEWNLVPNHTFGVRMVLFRLFEVAIIISIGWILLRFIDFIALIFLQRAQATDSKMDDQLVIFTREVVKVIFAVFGLFMVIGVAFNLDVVSLVTGLGIGGLAFALAAKETLENLLGSFTIFLDKPFKVGDQIKVGSTEGMVESIGIRTTRIRALDKSLIILPNKKMIDAELTNENERYLRRVRFTISLTYEAGISELKKVTGEIKNLLKSHPLVDENESVHFRNFGSSSLDILIQYFIMDPGYEKYLEVNEEINLRIVDIVEKSGCRFAYPTTSVYLEKSESAT